MISICVSLPDYYRKSASQITKVLEFTSINDRSDLVSHYYLLVNYLLPSGSDFINCYRAHPMGLYQHTHDRPAVWEKRAIPLSWSLLPKLGSSNVAEQKDASAEILPILKDYQVVVLGDRKFCSLELANWLREKHLHFCLRLKCSLCIETELEIWEPLKEVGLLPGISLYFSGVKVRKTQPIEGFDIACKWKRKYRGVSVKEGCFILTNLGSLKKAIAAYPKRMGIEEMFRDYKSGGYYLEGTGLGTPA